MDKWWKKDKEEDEWNNHHITKSQWHKFETYAQSLESIIEHIKIIII